MAWASSEELRIHLGLSSIDAVRADQLLGEAENAVKAEARQSIDEVAADVVELAGVWARTLKLPERPVTAVTAVTLVDAVGISRTITEYVWSRRGNLRRTDGGYWGGPDATVTVTYSHGYATPPRELNTLAVNLAARAWVNPARVRQEGVGTYQVSFADLQAEMTDREAELCHRYWPHP